MELQDEANQIINLRYKIIDTLGSGGIGTTYKAEKIETGETVALKIVSLKEHRNWKTIELFEREAEVLKTLNHNGIPKYLDYFEVETADDKLFCIAQQLAEGKSLDKWVNEGWRCEEKEIKDIAKQILKILNYLQSLKPPVIHRDIKPQNLIRSPEGKIFLVDFGAVQNTYYNTLKGSSTVVGTYGYMAPEHFRAVPATDLYSLGATILYLLLHRPPSELPRDNYDHLKIDFRTYVFISEGFAYWLEKMLEPTLEERFSSAKQSLKALRQSKSFKQRVSLTEKWQFWLGLGLTGIATLTFWNYKWLVLSKLGFYPPQLCVEKKVTYEYFKQGGKNPQQNPIYSNRLEMCVIIALAEYSETQNLELLELMINQGFDVNDIYRNAISHQKWSVRKNIDNYYEDYTHRRRWSRYNHDTYFSSGRNRINDDEYKLFHFLITKGANPNISNRQGFTLIQLLINQYYYNNSRNSEIINQEHKQSLIELLIEKGVNLNIPDRSGNTHLHVLTNRYYTKHRRKISTKEEESLIKLLIKNGANVNAKNYRGDTPLSFAEKRKNQELIKLLNINW